MNNIARSKIFIIIGAVIMTLLVIAIILIAIFLPKGDAEEKDSRTVEQIQEDNINEYFAGENGNEEAADVLNPENSSDAPPEDAYENSYEDDFGYVAVSDHESAKANPENTVYDDVWAHNKWAELNCDLNNKLTVSQKALANLNQFREDLAKVDSDMSHQLVESVDHLLSKMQNSRGERVPGEVKNITSANCEFLTDEVGP